MRDTAYWLIDEVNALLNSVAFEEAGSSFNPHTIRETNNALDCRLYSHTKEVLLIKLGTWCAFRNLFIELAQEIYEVDVTHVFQEKEEEQESEINIDDYEDDLF
mgnify:CR=1 FL=1